MESRKFITSVKGKTADQIARELYNFVVEERKRLQKEKNKKV